MPALSPYRNLRRKIAPRPRDAAAAATVSYDFVEDFWQPAPINRSTNAAVGMTWPDDDTPLEVIRTASSSSTLTPARTLSSLYFVGLDALHRNHDTVGKVFAPA